MLCKYCKQNTIVTDGVDNRDSDETYRLRVCPRCGRTFYTVEFPVEVDERFMNDWAKHHKQHKPLSVIHMLRLTEFENYARITSTENMDSKE